MKKIFLLVMLLASVFFTGCLKPNFTVKEGQIICQKIMAKNAKILSPGAPDHYKLTYISFDDNYYGISRGYTVQFKTRLDDGKLYTVTRRADVGKDEGGWYVEIVHPSSEKYTPIKLR